MALRVETVTIACVDPDRLSRFWLALLGYEVAPNYTDSIQTIDPTGQGRSILFAPHSHAKQAKNRFHLDLRPDDHTAEVERALQLGAQRIDIGQTGTNHGRFLPTLRATNSASCSRTPTTQTFDAATHLTDPKTPSAARAWNRRPAVAAPAEGQAASSCRNCASSVLVVGG